MPKVDITLETPVERSFRVDQVAGMFDVGLEAKSRERIRAEVPGLDEDWKVGLIYGPSGSGKSSVGREVYGEALVERYEWPADKAVVEGFGESVPVETVTAMLGAVGFSSPPAWVRPYRVLSGGQRFRCNLARALLTEAPVVAFDEFTSVVDRTVAKIGSACVAKAMRKGLARCGRFVAVSCHDDVEAWLEPDWVVDMSSSPATLARGCLQRGSAGARGTVRPGVGVRVYRCSRLAWTLYRKHHYLSGKLNRTARCYAAFSRVGDDVEVAVGFCATIQNAGHKGYRIVHRLVVLPDWQGVGIGPALLNAVAAVESVTHKVSINTSHPGLIHSLDKSDRWRAMSVNDGMQAHRSMRQLRGSVGRVTVSFRWVGR